MKILIINYRYFVSGGPERYLFNIKDMLEKNGHEVIPFSVKNKINVPTEYDEYFIDQVGDDNEIYFSEYKKTNVKMMVRTLSRMFYSLEAKRKLDKLIKAVKPDLLYVLHYQNKISASIFDAAAKNNVPVIHRISDFGQICANALFYRPIEKDICERCLTGSKINGIKYKCVENSYFLSAIKVAAVQTQKILHITKKVQAFVVPSNFTLQKLKLYGFPGQKLFHIPSFFNFQPKENAPEIVYKPFALYIGRIESEKGLLTMVKAFENTGFNLKIIGFSNSGFEEELKDYLKDKQHNVEFLGRKEFNEIQYYLGQCMFTIVPSECYDNFPNTILESFAFKKAVITTNSGSLKEIVVDNETGLLFKLKDVADLRSKINLLFQNETLSQELGKNGFEAMNREFSAKGHYDKLIHLFEKVIRESKKTEKAV